MEKNLKFCEKYNIDANEYERISIEVAPFSVRVMNRLKREKIDTIGQLLNCSFNKLVQISGFGTGCFNELYDYFSSLTDNNSAGSGQTTDCLSEKIPEFFRENREMILRGDFSFVNSDEYDELIVEYKNAKDILGDELIGHCIYKPEYIISIRQAFNQYYCEYDVLSDRLSLIPECRRRRSVKNYIEACTDNEVFKSALFGHIVSTDETLEQFIRNNVSLLKKESSIITQFAKACLYDLKEMWGSFLDDISKNERAFEIVKRRSEGMTLEQVGNEYQVTRERVRQIEKKVSTKFVKWVNLNAIINKIYADLDEKIFYLPFDFKVFFENYLSVFCYLLKINEEDFAGLYYDKQFDLFVIGDDSFVTDIQKYVEELPNTFKESLLDNYIIEANMKLGYPKEIIKIVIEDYYKKTADVYHRSRLTLGKIYKDILYKYYPNGIWVYSDTQINEFKKHVIEEYGDIKLPEKNRAIVARIADVGILCDRGTYRPKSEKYISDDLAKKIHDYIEQSDTPIFLTNTIFTVFEEELECEGVTNKYFLQGILHELFEDEFVFKRDYISKDENFTSIYSEIVSYIEQATYPVTKQQLNEKFPGVTEIVINLSISDPNIINMFGVYMHASKLKLTDENKKYVKEVVALMIEESGYIHCRDIYDYVFKDNSNILTSNGIYQAFGFYSVLEYLFCDEFEFSRPYVGKKGQEITRTFDHMQEMVRESDVIQLADVISVARNNHFQLSSILEFANSCNETHLLLNDKELAAIDYIGISHDMARVVERCIFDSIEETMYVSDLKCLNQFPRLSVTWTEWLIYSVLNKWSDILEVSVTSTVFKQAKAVVAKKGKLDMAQLNENSRVEDIYVPDDLDNIDELISDILIEEIEGLDDI